MILNNIIDLINITESKFHVLAGLGIIGSGAGSAAVVDHLRNTELVQQQLQNKLTNYEGQVNAAGLGAGAALGGVGLGMAAYGVNKKSKDQANAIRQ